MPLLRVIHAIKNVVTSTQAQVCFTPQKRCNEMDKKVKLTIVSDRFIVLT